MLYLDHNASSPPTEAIRRRWNERLQTGLAGNPGAVHQAGQAARSLLERTRKTVLHALHGLDGSLVFTSGATEANNLLIESIPEGHHVWYSPLCHASMLAPLQRRARGLHLHGIPHDTCGRWSPEEIVAGWDAHPGPTWVLVTAANNELGNLHPWEALAQHAAARGVRLHVDAAQVWGRFPLTVVPGLSSLTLSAHKAGGWSGTGALWVASAASLKPLIVGGGQERGRRAGTENVLLHASLADVLVGTEDGAWSTLASLRDGLQAWMVERYGAVVNGDIGQRLPNTLNLSFPDRSAEEVVMALDLAGVCVSAGSACAAGSTEVSHVLAALELPAWRARGAVRISLGPEHAHLGLEAFTRPFAKALG